MLGGQDLLIGQVIALFLFGAKKLAELAVMSELPKGSCPGDWEVN